MDESNLNERAKRVWIYQQRNDSEKEEDELSIFLKIG